MKNLLLKNFGFIRKCGVLMAVSSLPSPYGIGCFGKPCYDFIDFLVESGQTVWQILPLNPTAYGDSPYQSPSSFAGNPYFINLNELKKQKLLSSEEVASAKKTGAVNYGFLFETRITLLKKAFSRFKPTEKYYDFLEDNEFWLDDYALFMAIKLKFDYRPWNEWDYIYKNYNLAKFFIRELPDVEFFKWLQYEFFCEWQKVKSYAKDRGISILGDMPIYVSYDSVEVWSNPDIFLLSEDLNPTVVAGVPPDGFSPDGQLWGNPVYNWEKLKEDGFSWWIQRFCQNLNLYDIVRVDHFRGFAGYYVVPFGDKTAKNGEWRKGVGKELFTAVKKALPDAKIVAEDLGFITPDVRELLDFTSFPGMKVLQFAFDEDDNEYLPRKYKTENTIAYTGSHDSECTFSWCKNLSGDRLKRFKKEVVKAENRTYSLIETALNSKANLVIIPLQDYLKLSSEKARMNTPSVPQGNWTWRVKSYKKISDKLKELAVKYGRNMEKL